MTVWCDPHDPGTISGGVKLSFLPTSRDMSPAEVLIPPPFAAVVPRQPPPNSFFVVEGPPLEDLLPKIELLESDGDKLDTEWHRFVIDLLSECLHNHLRGREDYYANGNSFIYFSEAQARNLDYRGPDFFFVKNVERRIRPYWCVWQEGGRYPNAIIELASPSTIRTDRTVKKDIYEQIFRTPEYYLYDHVTGRLEGWRLDDHGVYRPLVLDERRWLWSEQLQLWLGVWSGTCRGYTDRWLRFFDPQGVVVPSDEELKVREQERVLLEQERVRRAEQQTEEALVEVARLRELLAQRGGGAEPHSP